MKKVIIALFITVTLSLIVSNVFAHSEPFIIKMTDNGFEPREAKIDSDTTLIFQNTDNQDHWPASDLHPTHDIYPEFDPAQPIKPSQSWAFKPGRIGTFKFHDHLLPHRKGVLNISGEEKTTTSPNKTSTPLDIQKEIARITLEGVLRQKKQGEDSNNYIKSQMGICFKNGGRDYCYKDLASLLFYQFNFPDILELLQKNETSEAVFARCHELTHYVSRLSFEKEKNITSLYSQCTSVCHGGCYHGIVEQYLSNKKLSLDSSNALNQEIPKICGKQTDYKVPLLYDECLHGVGHATMYVSDGDLIKALEMCGLLSSEKDRQTCYSGSFMENSSSSTNLDHPSKFIKKDDPMYPCNILDRKYLDICYRYQSSYFAILTQSNWKEVAKLCQMTPKEYQKMCFLTVGSNQVGFTQDFKTISDDCMLMPTNSAKNYCFQGAVDALAIRYRGEFDKGVRFCSMIDPNFQKDCFRQYGQSVASWSNNLQDQIKLCDSIGNLNFASWCKSANSNSSSLFISLLKKLTSKFNEILRGISFRQIKTSSQNFQKISFNDQTDFLKNMAQSQGLEKTWQYLTDTFKNESGSMGQVHDLAHFMGSLIYDEKGFEGLKICSPSFAFGCFHGFLDKAFQKSLNDLSKAEDGCKLVGNVNSGSFASCIHGIGHGVASFYATSDLNNALYSCDKLTAGSQFCYDGVFMEFARNASAQFYKSGDPLYPCDEVEEKYVYSCGRNQPQVMMQRYKYSFEQMAEACVKDSSQNFKSACVSALGFITAANTYGKADGILASCRRFKDPNYVSTCAISAAGELVFQNYPSWKDEAPKVCKSLGEFQKKCEMELKKITLDYQR